MRCLALELLAVSDTNAFFMKSVHGQAYYQLQTWSLYTKAHGRLSAAMSCPQRIWSFCVLVDCVIAQLEPQQDKLFEAEHFQLLWSDSSRFLSEDSRAMWHTAAGAVSGSMWSLYTVARSNRQQLAPGEWRWTGHIHNLHKNVTGKRLTNHMDPCWALPGMAFYSTPGQVMAFKKRCLFTAVFLASLTEGGEKNRLPMWCWMKWEEHLLRSWHFVAFSALSFWMSCLILNADNLIKWAASSCNIVSSTFSNGVLTYGYFRNFLIHFQKTNSRCSSFLAKK